MLAPAAVGQKIYLHPKRIKDALANPAATFPITLDVDPTTTCNSRCPKCTFPNTGKMFLDFDLFKRTIKEAAQLGVKAVAFTGGGEPTLHPRFIEMVKTVKENGLEAGLITNGLAFSARMAEETLPMLEWVRFSLDAGSAEMYHKTHGLNEVQFNKLASNITSACKIRKRLGFPIGMGASYLILEANEADFQGAIRIARGTGLNFLQFKPMQLHDLCAIGGFTYDLEVLRSAERMLKEKLTGDYGETFHVYLTRMCPHLMGKGSVEYRESPLCYGQRFTTSLGADGRLYACCHYKYDPRFELGNLNFSTFQQIWTSKQRHSLLFGIQPQKSCLNNCKLEGLNEDLHRLAGLTIEEMEQQLREKAGQNCKDANFI